MVGSLLGDDGFAGDAAEVAVGVCGGLGCFLLAEGTKDEALRVDDDVDVFHVALSFWLAMVKL
jgi:ammonia channel protein AmtB